MSLFGKLLVFRFFFRRFWSASRRVPTGGVFAGLGEGDEGVEEFFDGGEACGFEVGGDGFGGEGFVGLLEDGSEGFELVGEGFGPRNF